MKASKILTAIVIVSAVLLAQFRTALAAPANDDTQLSGTIQSITLETDVNTAVTTVLVTIVENSVSQTVRISVDTAKALGLVTTDENGTPVINTNTLGTPIQIDTKAVILDDEANRHPVGDALATFFAQVTDYETIMKAHEDGAGFGVIAQALWLTQKLKGDSETFLAILEAKKTGDYSAFTLEDGTVPTNWGQFKKAVLGGNKNGNLGIVMSNKNKDNHGNGYHNNGNGNHGNGHGNGNGNNKDGNKDKDK